MEANESEAAFLEFVWLHSFGLLAQTPHEAKRRREGRMRGFPNGYPAPVSLCKKLKCALEGWRRRKPQKPCVAALGLLESALMYLLANRDVRWFKPAIAGLMSAIVLLLTVFAACEDLHRQLHQDSAAPHHGPCAVCSVAGGQVELPAVVPSVGRAAPSIAWTLPVVETRLPQAADFSVASSRGPPAPVSSV
jgi:hypothetical protein